MPPKGSKARTTKNSKRAQAEKDATEAVNEGVILDSQLASVPPFEDAVPAPPKKKSKASSSSDTTTIQTRPTNADKIQSNISSLKGIASSGAGNGERAFAKSEISEDLQFVQRSEAIKSILGATTYKLSDDDTENVKIAKIQSNADVFNKAWGFMEKNLDTALKYSTAIGEQKVLNIEKARDNIIAAHKSSKNDSFKVVTNKMLMDMANGVSSDMVTMGTGTSSVFIAKTVNNVLPLQSLPPALMDEMNDPGAVSPTIEDVTDTQ